jgi:WXG100 family type VII secretion target
MSGPASAGSPDLRVYPETLQKVSAALQQTASTFHDEIVRLSARGDALLDAWKGHAGPTFVEPFEEWRSAANDVVERLKTSANLISQASSSYVRADQS